MKNGMKLLLIIFSIWLLFICSLYLIAKTYFTDIAGIEPNIFNYFVINFFVISTLFFLLLQCLIYIFIVKPVSSTSKVTNIKDNLLGFTTHDFFIEILNKSISNAQRSNKLLAILLINFDYHDKATATHARIVDDQMLKEISFRIANTLRAGDIIARADSNRLKVLINDLVKPRIAGNIAEKILQECTPQRLDSFASRLIVSIGVCIYPHDGQTIEVLNKNLELATEKARNTGGGIYQYSSEQMDKEVHDYIRSELSLRQAIQNNELILYYQPQLDLVTRSIKSVEALVRWNHPEYGIINPDEFIPLAEESGLIMQLGEWTLEEACKKNKLWQAEGYDPITVAVNFSAKQFHQQDVVQMVANALERHQLEPRYLEVEITETTIMEDIDSAVIKLRNLITLGINISIDDFGMGYTSINYLKKLPVTILKIDKSFIDELPNNKNDAAITIAIIALGHNLGLKIIAEGVETAQQLQFLAEQECDSIQGDFFCKALPANEVVERFKKNNM